MTKTVQQRAAEKGLKLTKTHRRKIQGESRICVYVDGQLMTWKDMLIKLNNL